MKYHINPKSGAVTECNAKIRCRWGGASGNENHFSNKAAAEKAVETALQKRYAMQGVSKPKRGRTSNFDKNKNAILLAMKEAKLATSQDSLPEVANEKELIEKWFNGDKAQYELIKNVSENTELKKETIHGIGRLSEQGKTSFVKTGNFEGDDLKVSNVDIIDDVSDMEFDLEAIRSGKIKAF